MPIPPVGHPAIDLHRAADMLRSDAAELAALRAQVERAKLALVHLNMWRNRAASSRTWDRGEEIDLLGELLDQADAALAPPQPVAKEK